jgi:hypothetical protein
MGGLTKDEVAGFVVNLLEDDEASIQRAFEAIQSFRTGYEKLKGKVAKGKYAAEVLQKRTPQGRKPATLVDYADSSMRYARMSGLITLEATGGRFILAPSKLELVEWILDDPPAKIPDQEYLSALHSPTIPPLPTDNAVIADRQIQKLQEEYKRLAKSVDREVEPYSSPGESIVEKQSGIRNLEKQIVELREFDFYRRQRGPEALKGIRELLQNILADNLPLSQRYAPAFLEWALWRLLLAINEIRNPIPETRGFRVDDELVPIHHAAPNIADCRFIYDDFIILVETTLTRSHRQVEAEVFPVLNHTARTMFEFPDKEVYCLFVAPKIDSNVFRHYYEGIYDLGEVEYKANVVALTISEVLSLIDAMLTKKRILDSIEFRAILQGILDLRQKYPTGKEWGKNYSTHFAEYIAQI